RDEAEAAFGALFECQGTPAQMGGFLMALRTRGETVDEYTAAATVMRLKCNPVRAELGTRTIFNILGPLTNPAGVKRQLTGAFSAALIRPMAETLLALGTQKAWLVHGSDGTDEISICGATSVSAVENGEVRDFTVHPEDAGLAPHPFEAILGGTPAENAAAFRALLDGALGAYRDAVLLNAAAALVVADRVGTLTDGVALAREAIDSGAARAKVQALARLTNA
ncbi:MAG: hypothetical protein NTW20_10425, partial [Rhodobacterales bacterium]|nr:hypothetical protein [Rhodobacterales bacterium]